MTVYLNNAKSRNLNYVSVDEDVYDDANGVLPDVRRDERDSVSDNRSLDTRGRSTNELNYVDHVAVNGFGGFVSIAIYVRKDVVLSINKYAN
jgi:hypothetical protein